MILQEKGRLVRIMGDHFWREVSIIEKVTSLVGGVDGTRENAIRLVNNNELILAYPGGVREIFQSQFRKEYLNWNSREGFANVSMKTNSPVIPIASIGVNNGFIFLSKGRLTGKIIYKWILRLGSKFNCYYDPLVLGILPFPLPLSIGHNFPLPCKLRYLVGEPIYPKQKDSNNRIDPQKEFAKEVETKLKELINKYK